MYLITYYFKHNISLFSELDDYHYDFAESVEDWLDKSMQYNDGKLLLINSVFVAKEFADNHQDLID